MNVGTGEGSPPRPNKPRPPLITKTTTVEKKQDVLPNGSKGPIQKTIVTKIEGGPIK